MELKNQILLYFNKLNNNNRIYIKDEFTRLRVETAHHNIYEYTLLEKLNGRIWLIHENKRSLIEKPEIFGEIGHPERLETNLRNISHSIRNIKIEGDILVGDIEILDSPNGNILRKLMEIGPESIVFRPRSTGTINNKNQVVNLVVFSFDAIEKKEDPF